MEENKIAIQRYLSKPTSVQYSTIKIKGTTYFIKDGIITYKILLNSFVCPCSQNQLCNHRIFILNTHFKLDFIVITFIHKLLPKLCENISNPSINILLSKIIHDEFLADECDVIFI